MPKFFILIMTKTKYKAIINWLFLGYFLILLMVIIGGITRLTGSGLSMADWKPIMGAIPPLNEADWQEKFELYKATPEFKIINKDFNLEDFKSIFWWEFIHRDLGRLIGLIFIFPFLLFWIQGRFDKKLLQKMFIILTLGAFQGLLGWYMVSSGLDKIPHVSHYRLAAHFVTALSAMLYIFWVAISLIYPYSTPNKTINKQGKRLFVLVLLQIIFGAFTAGLKAGFGNFDFIAIFSIPNQIKDWFNHGESVLFVHRYIGLFILIYATYIFFRTKKEDNVLPHQKTAILVVYALILLQVSLGISTLLLAVPISLAVLHQVVAVLVITSILYLIKRS